jgi:phospholipid/cholesterol/gamma-HCH transport system ATP-binding protein
MLPLFGLATEWGFMVTVAERMPTMKSPADGETKAAVQIRDLRKAFGTQTVLAGINLDLASGKTLTIMGQSGTGKSVLLKLIIGLQKPDSGAIQIGDSEITQLSVSELNKVRMKIGFLFQYAALYDSLTVEENVSFPLRRHTEMSKSERHDRVHSLLSRVGMQEASRKMPAEISGGMKKRVGLARALAMDPELMLMDEPTAGLDPIKAGEINSLIRELQQERHMTAIVVTHEMQTVKAVSDSIAMLHEGHILTQGSFEQLRKSQDPFISAFMREAC